jgi:hypothetical protein
MVSTSIFFEFNLPNGTTWFYFSFLLAVALFFKFSRVLSVRNWDVVAMFLLTPGFLLLQEARSGSLAPEIKTPVAAATLIGASANQAILAPVNGSCSVVNTLAFSVDAGLSSSRLLWFGYLWLLCGSSYFLVRCLLDLVLVTRPALGPNLSFGGMAWLAGALFVCLMAVAYRPERAMGGKALPPDKPPHESPNNLPVGRESASLALARHALTTEAHDSLEFFTLVKRTLAVVCHVIVVTGLIFIGYLHFQDLAAGMAAATFYLMLPYTGIYVGQAHHVWPMALILWAIVAYRLPILAGCLLGVAAATTYFPALLLPIWLSFYRNRGMGRFLAAFLIAACVLLGAVGLILSWRGELPQSLRDALTWPAWQPWVKPTTEGFWTGVHWAYRIPVFMAYLAFVVTTAFWPNLKNLAHVIALSAAVLIGIQFWYADKGGIYVLWYLPLLLLLVFRPNLSERRPAQIHLETDWLARLRRDIAGLFYWHVRTPEPPVRTG